jgi:hypothetical protein
VSPRASLALGPAPSANASRHREDAGEPGNVTNSSTLAMVGEKSPRLRLPPSLPPQDDKTGALNHFLMDAASKLGLRTTRDAWVRSAKACVLAAKVKSTSFTFAHVFDRTFVCESRQCQLRPIGMQ